MFGMKQRALFHDSIFDAIGADIAAAGGFKVVASKLWPSKDMTVAANVLRNAINPDQAQKLDVEEVLRIKQLAKEHDSFATVSYEAQQLHFQVTWIEPEDELTKLLREYLGDQQRQTHRKERIDSLIAKTQIRAVG